MKNNAMNFKYIALADSVDRILRQTYLPDLKHGLTTSVTATLRYLTKILLLYRITFFW